ncbi:RidA family protein [Flavimarina sp. Hel_I_48]|uniref:RidA family protein n=1 Tax=Flavimarina sp. Hel_I_48 TaxID=1392488 RepID=UPI0004DF9D4B|nr:RidA family protein [Flavimarina sp. Hel_I_48]
MNIEDRIKELNLQLPPAPPLGGVYKPVIQVGNMLYVSGQGPVRNDTSLITGKLGKDLTTREGYDAARQVGLTMLATMKAQLGDLKNVKRLVKTLGMVNGQPDFYDHPKVINGFSELMVELLGDDLGKGARSAVGMTLPGNIAVEIEAIFEMHGS